MIDMRQLSEVSSLLLWVPRINLRSSGLMAGAMTHQQASPGFILQTKGICTTVVFSLSSGSYGWNKWNVLHGETSIMVYLGQLHLPSLGMLKTQTLLPLPVPSPSLGIPNIGDLSWSGISRHLYGHQRMLIYQSGRCRALDLGTQHLWQSSESRNIASTAELWI